MKVKENVEYSVRVQPLKGVEMSEKVQVSLIELKEICASLSV